VGGIPGEEKMGTTKVIALWGYDEYASREWIEIPLEFEAEILAHLERYYDVAGFLEPRREIQSLPISKFLAYELDRLLFDMLPYGIGREKFGSLADVGDWEGWNEIARREVYRDVMQGTPYYKVVPDLNAPMKSSASMAVIMTDELLPPRDIFEYRWADYQEKLAKYMPQYTSARELLNKVGAWEGEDD